MHHTIIYIDPPHWAEHRRITRCHKRRDSMLIRNSIANGAWWAKAEGNDTSFPWLITKPRLVLERGTPKMDGGSTGRDVETTFVSAQEGSTIGAATLLDSNRLLGTEDREGAETGGLGASLTMGTHSQIGPLLNIPFYKRTSIVRYERRRQQYPVTSQTCLRK